MDFLYLLVKSLLLPPGLFVLFMVLGFMFRRLSFIILTLVTLYLFSTPFVARQLVSGLEIYPALTEAQVSKNQAQAIVVLGAGRYPAAPEYNGNDMAAGLVRMRYAAYLHRKTGLTIYATGGSPYQKGVASEAELMKKSLEQEFNTGPVIVEGESANTRENALFTAKLLKQAGIKKVFLVSNAWHLPRAVTEFSRTGIEVVPAPTQLSGKGGVSYRQWLPRSFAGSRIAFREYLGQAWYKLHSLWDGFQGEPAGIEASK
mgnify:CR=1 FL=1